MKSRRYVQPSLRNALVKKSARWNSDTTRIIGISSIATRLLMKWRRTSMCLKLEFVTGFSASWMVSWLSSNTGMHGIPYLQQHKSPDLPRKQYLLHHMNYKQPVIKIEDDRPENENLRTRIKILETWLHSFTSWLLLTTTTRHKKLYSENRNVGVLGKETTVGKSGWTEFPRLFSS